jgi:hypothetical protein
MPGRQGYLLDARFARSGLGAGKGPVFDILDSGILKARVIFPSAEGAL